MAAPDVELIRAMMDALKADATVSGYVVARIYDRPPQDQKGLPKLVYPYITFGPSDATPVDADCITAEEITQQIDVWAQGENELFSSAQCRKIADAVKRRLHGAELVLTENALASLQLTLKTTLREPDGFTSHGVLQFTATVEIPA